MNNKLEQSGVIELSYEEVVDVNGGSILIAVACIGMAGAVLYRELMRYR